ncbi:ROK family protein, partial [Bacteroides xylanisolvens]
MYEYDKRVVLTLDAGGTNFVFSAIQGNNEMISPISLPAVSDNLDECLEVLVKGFDRVIAAISVPPVAISFAFPGPADYKNGIIGDLPNFPSFRGGVALGPFLKHKYRIPVFIENDGNLFAYGEALSGALPMINRELSLAGCSREYKNLIGITLGTGFGAGVVIDKVLWTGDNGCG